MQNKYQDSKNNLPILLEILEDLEKLEYAYVFKGQFCPLIEHRCPSFSDKDGDGTNTMSYAQRSHQFRMVGHRIIKNCRKIVFLTPKEHLPNVLEICVELNSFLCSKKTPDSKTYFDLMINILMYELNPECIKNNSDPTINIFIEKLRQFHEKLDRAIQEELPSLGNNQLKQNLLIKVKYFFNKAISMDINKRNVIMSYIYGFSGALILVTCAHYCALWLNSYHLFSEASIQWIQNFSIVPGAAALYAERNIKTWSECSPAEKTDKKILKILLSIGFFLAILAFHLKS
ncbi:MAG: hypothetical protein P4L31_06915 [Candidatus Babeliales bacterium]|nr:hypothetical protein [Candidatus Babeliales bacterium]